MEKISGMTIIVFILLLIGLYFWNKKVERQQIMKYDLIIRFKNQNCFVDIRNYDQLSELASWSKYGEYGFRGLSLVNKDNLEQSMINTLNISKDSFSIINPAGMYIPS